MLFRSVTESLLSPEELRAAVAELGFELVDVTGGDARDRVVRLRIDRPGGAAPGAGVTTEDCARVSRALADRWGERWAGIEVSSPGIERPIRFVDHWRRYIGHEVAVRAAGIRGRQRARIVAVPDDRHVELEMAGARQVVALAGIRSATLVVDWSALG